MRRTCSNRPPLQVGACRRGCKGRVLVARQVGRQLGGSWPPGTFPLWERLPFVLGPPCSRFPAPACPLLPAYAAAATLKSITIASSGSGDAPAPLTPQVGVLPRWAVLHDEMGGCLAS